MLASRSEGVQPNARREYRRAIANRNIRVVGADPVVLPKPAPKQSLKPAPPKPEEAWHSARLIPTSGIGGQDEQEQRATSSLLAVMKAVPQFGRALVAHLAAPAGVSVTCDAALVRDRVTGKEGLAHFARGIAAKGPSGLAGIGRSVATATRYHRAAM
jgi:hypothetical protein